MAELIDGIVATSAGVFHSGRDFAELFTQSVADDSDHEVVLDLRTYTQSSIFQELTLLFTVLILVCVRKCYDLNHTHSILSAGTQQYSQIKSIIEDITSGINTRSTIQEVKTGGLLVQLGYLYTVQKVMTKHLNHDIIPYL